MGLRSPSSHRTPVATSGPGRGPASDVRARRRRSRSHGYGYSQGRGYGYGYGRGRVGRRRASAEMLRLRAEALFAEAEQEGRRGRGDPEHGPPSGVPAGNGSASAGLAPARAPAAAPGGGPDAAPGGRPHGAPGGGPDGPGAVEDTAGSTGDAERAEPSWRGRAVLALRERLPLWLQLRCGLERRSVAALAVVLVAAAVFAVQHFWTGRTEPVRVPDVVRAEAPAGGEEAVPDASAGAGAGATAGAVPDGGGAAIVVDVSGKVRNPGIHELPAGSRVADALRAAGGVRPGTDIGGLNRARLLMDGEQVVVGVPPGAAGGGPAVPGAGAAGVGPGAAAAGPVSLNTATAEQLDTLPGVGPVLAQHIIDYRTQHGGFRSVDELREVNGIGDRRFADLQNLVGP
ncbi:ComEA family DNA-binding protein [Streptomyces sp. NPDC002896]|uniref:ComEA family DNA-binding protein n=1 Tax=Streptomyces sp. NPDC002896 TaxID=3154438 RepID=UPI00331A1299